MQSAVNSSGCYQTVVLAAIVAGSLATPAPAEELMPAAQQNALVRKYCAVCHTDAEERRPFARTFRCCEGAAEFESNHVEQTNQRRVAPNGEGRTLQPECRCIYRQEDKVRRDGCCGYPHTGQSDH